MTLAVRVIPCLDVANGRVVKGVNFVALADAGDPVEAARAYDAAGADELTFLDITASHEGRGTLLDIVRRTASVCFMPLTVGGGVRTVDDVRALLLSGADKVAVNSAAVERPALVGELSRHFGEQCITVSVDAKSVSPGRWEVFTHGGRRATGIDAVQYSIDAAKAGAGEILLTSMDRDGTRSGYDLALTRAVADAVPVPVVASGGVGGVDDLVAGVRDGHASAVLAASIFHFGQASVAEAKARMAAAGIEVRGVASGTEVGGAAGGAEMRSNWSVIAAIVARRSGDPGESYVARLTARGRAKIAQKLGEEAVETVIAAMQDDRAALVGEATDLVFHLAVLLADAGLGFDDIRAELLRREGVSGLAEKARRKAP